MLKQILPVFVILAFLGTRAHAQVAPQGMDITPEQQEMFQQMQQIGQQMMQNMQNAGVDPQEFFQQMGQQMQDGTFDPAAFQQTLIDKGYITQDMVNQIQGTFQKAALSGIRQQLHADDQEWGVLLPKLQRVLKAKAEVEVNQQQQMGLGGGFAAPAASDSESAKAFKALGAAVNDPAAPPEKVAQALAAWRTAHAKAKTEYAAAEADLVNVLTIGQEATLLDLGVIW